jgi:hypothetical protein
MWRQLFDCYKKEIRFNGLACRTNQGYPSEAELKCFYFNKSLARPTGALTQYGTEAYCERPRVLYATGLHGDAFDALEEHLSNLPAR